MFLYTLLLLVGLLGCQIHAQLAKQCPNACRCYLDTKGRNTVECKRGGMKGPIQFTNMSTSMEVLKITAPDDNMNDLSMNPGIRSYTKLEEVHITKSNIPNLGERFFVLKRLEILNLTQNNITQPLPMNFIGLSGLKDLYLDDNRISSLPSEAFRYLAELRLLSLQKNRLQEMAVGIFRDLNKLRVLKLSGNYLKAFNADVFKDLKELRFLECRGCHLAAINQQTIEKLPFLAYLDLSENEIKAIDSTDFVNNTNLRDLKLDANQIRALPAAVLATNTDLRRLTLSKNLISDMHAESFANLANLTELDLAFNKLHHLEPDILAPISETLERLVFSGNQIPLGDIQEVIRGTSVKDLQLAECGIQNVNEMFAPESVVVLNLANNQLSHLSGNVLPIKLRELDLTRNLFRGLDHDVVERIEHIRCKLDNNPWSCDLCHIIPMLERANTSSLLANVRCALPYNQHNVLLGALQREKLSWCNTPGYEETESINSFLNREDGRLGIIAAGASLMLLILTTIAVLGALCYSRRYAAKYYTNEEKRDEKESIFEKQCTSTLFGEELSFKFPHDQRNAKISIATIDEIKNEQELTTTTGTRFHLDVL